MDTSTAISLPMPGTIRLPQPPAAPSLAVAGPKTVRVADEAPFLQMPGVEGRFLAAFENSPAGIRVEAWRRISSCEGRRFYQNLRVFLESEAGVRYWDLGPSLRRTPGGALLPDGITSETIKIETGEFQVKVNSHTGNNSEFELVELKRSVWGLSKGASLQIFAIPDDQQLKMRALKEHWEQTWPDKDDPGRLFKCIEDSNYINSMERAGFPAETPPSSYLPTR